MLLNLELPLEPGVRRVIAAVQADAQAQGLDPWLMRPPHGICCWCMCMANG